MPLPHAPAAAARSRSAVALRHLRSQVADPRAAREADADATASAASGSCSPNEYLPALQQPNVDARDRRRSRRSREHAHRHRGRQRARGRHDRLRDGLPRDRHAARRMAPRARRAHARRALARQPAGVPGHDDRRLPEPVHAASGPNTGLGHNSIVFMIEAQLELHDRLPALRWTSADRRDFRGARGGRSAASTRRSSGASRARVWNTGGCASWYLDVNGQNTVIWPGSTWPFRRAPAPLRPRPLRAAPRSRIAPVRPASTSRRRASAARCAPRAPWRGSDARRARACGGG